MTISGKALLVSLGIAASGLVYAMPASAQYYGRGYERADRYDQGYNRRALEAQKRAVKAQREAQRRAMRGGAYQRPGYGYAPQRPGYGPAPNPNIYNNGPTGGGFVVRRGPYGNYAVPVAPPDNGKN